MPVRGGYLAIGGAGIVFLWSGLKGKSVSSVLRNVIAGKSPQSATAANQVAGTSGDSGSASGTVGGTPPNAATVAAYKAYAMTLLTAHGWAGQYPAFNSIVMAESGWNNTAMNPSGAFGIAQALGHGDANTGGKYGNQYGNFGTSDTVCRAANNGSGTAQVQWMMNYIAEKFGSPNTAWSYHRANGYY